MQGYDFIVLPVNQVPPFPIEQPYITEIDGVKIKLHRMDEVVLPDHRDRASGNLGAVRIYRRWPAGRPADRGTEPRRV